MDIALYVLAALLIVGGLAGAVLPALPGIPMLFGGIWLVAAVDHYQHLGLWWLLIIGVLGGVGVTMDFVASTLGAKRVGASKLALWGAALGTLAGMFFGIPGLLFGPFLGGHWPANWPPAPACCVRPTSASAPGSACCSAPW